MSTVTAHASTEATQSHATDHAAPLPLYLRGQKRTQVLCDGSALVVVCEQSATRRYPFGRISRVISRGIVDWRTSAITACMNEHVPVVFVDGDGAPSGYMLPALALPSRLDRVLREAFELPSAIAQYRNWQRAERMRVLRRWRQRQVDQGREVSDAAFKEMARQYVYLENDASFRLAGAHVYNAALSGFALEQVINAGAQPRYWAHQGVAIDVVKDIGELLGQAMALELLGLGQGANGDLPTLLRVLHGFGPRLREETRCYLGSLHRFMQESLETWR